MSCAATGARTSRRCGGCKDAMAARAPDGDGLWSERGAGLACGSNGIVYNHRELRRAHRGSGRGLLRRDYVDRLLADPNGERTTLDGSKLRQVALLELWLQAHTG